MNKQFYAICFLGAIVGTLGLMTLANPVSACSTHERIFNNCSQSILIIGGLPSQSTIEAYRVRQEQQLTMIVAAYNSTFTTNIAQFPVQQTLVKHQLRAGKVVLSSIALGTASSVSTGAASLNGSPSARLIDARTTHTQMLQ
ncbi:MAG: hypothetical protein HC879_15975 [Leptolyngbyaceae cyanobacterium SL_5_9]|nr:hypothetical protein [Leptolyngbyaceae cyanobacterium SL_5_9]NJO76063.1 hypothetical protein [Leptolyngbyaceae cyanobacterium RM1_406_9]